VKEEVREAVKLSFFGGLDFGRVGVPDVSDETVRALPPVKLVSKNLTANTI